VFFLHAVVEIERFSLQNSRDLDAQKVLCPSQSHDAEGSVEEHSHGVKHGKLRVEKQTISADFHFRLG